MPETMQATHGSNGARLVSVEGADFPLRSVELRAEAQGGLARVVVSQMFANPHEQPLKAIYTLPLPAGGAVAAYQFRIGDRRVAGEVDRREKARERFEQALIEGRTAGLLDQERSNLFTQEIGNIPPRTEVAVEITVDQRLDWLAEGMWEWRYPTVAAPRYLGAAGRVEDASRVTLDVAGGPTGVRARLDLLVRDEVMEGRLPESPSHRLSARSEGAATRVALTDEGGAALDRDLVVRWASARPRAGVFIQVARPEAGRGQGDHAYGLVTIVPPEPAAALTIPRDLILLLDTSGSMSGRPLGQAKRVAGMLIESLGESDRLEMIAFSHAPRRWRSGAVAATPSVRAEAHVWLAGLEAGGGTEMLGAVEEALRPLREGAQRQVVIVTDGMIGFEGEVVGALRDQLPEGSRFHAVGVGSAANDALLRPAARAGRGARIVVDLDEDAERCAARLIAATREPVVVDLEISGTPVSGCVPRRLPDLLAGAPVLACLKLRPEGGEVVVRGRAAGEAWERRVSVSPAEVGAGDPAVIALYARETVEDLEMDLAAGAGRKEIDAEIERIGLAFGISTRMTSWVAISTEPSVDPRQAVRRVVIPQELPYGMSAEGLGLRGANLASTEMMYKRFGLFSDMKAVSLECPIDSIQETEPTGAWRVFFGRWVGALDPELQVHEFEVIGEPLNWDPAPTAILQKHDGTQIETEVDLAATTQPGMIQVGSLIRLALRLSRELSKEVAPVTIESAGVKLRIIRIGP